MTQKRTEFKLTREKREVLSKYLDYKKTLVNSKSKMNNYRYFISLFLENSKTNIEDYGEDEIVKFLNSIGHKYSVGTINELKWMLKSFICWYYEDYSKRFRNLDRILKLQRKEKTYSPEQMLKKEDIQKLVQEEPELRWKAFFLLYFYGGFRPIEVCELKWKDITFADEGCYVKTISNKNHKEFQKYIPQDVCFYLKKLQEKNRSSIYVFPTKRTRMKLVLKQGIALPVGDKPMTRSGVYQHLLPLAKRVLGKHVNPYILRHSVATILYNRDDLKDDDVAQQLGHSKAMKETYNNLSIEKIRARMKKIWIKPEDLPPETRENYEKRIAELEEFVKNLKGEKNNVVAGFNMLMGHQAKLMQEIAKSKFFEAKAIKGMNKSFEKLPKRL